ncbi:MAG: DUF6355 family natural product biosynthesis protein [Pseudonocardiaceae bacterium]
MDTQLTIGSLPKSVQLTHGGRTIMGFSMIIKKVALVSTGILLAVGAVSVVPHVALAEAQASTIVPMSTATTADVATPQTHIGAPAPAPHKCGFYKDTVTAWYNHCTNDHSHVWVHIDYSWTGTDRCLPEGVSDIGAASDVTNAFYTGLCNPGLRR